MKNYTPQDNVRDYNQEAKEMIMTLGFEKQYELYDIVLKKQKWSNSPTRDLELAAVVKAIEGTRAIDKDRLVRIKRGYKSSMVPHVIPSTNVPTSSKLQPVIEKTGIDAPGSGFSPYHRLFIAHLSQT